MSDEIIVATDGSPESITAARWAAQLAARLAGRLVVLDVLQQPYAELPVEDAERFELDARHALGVRLRSAGVDVDETRAIVGDVATVLPRASRDAMMLVLGSAERVGWGRHGHFSLVHALAHHVTCPIVVIPAGPWIDRDPVMVVGVDGSSASRRTLEWAVEFGARARFRVIAAFVIDDIYATFGSAGWYGADEQHARRESIERSVELVERFGADPAVSLEAIAAQYGAALLVVGAKHRHSLGGTLLGAIPDELLHHPTCPIAVIPHTLTRATESVGAVAGETPGHAAGC